ncbi:MAG: hypothetical protein ACRDG9_08895 [Actinomycetota bacterium]
MFGHVSGRKRRSRWAILSFLLALALAWSLAAMREQTILWVGLAVGLGISLLITFVSSRRLRRARKNDERETHDEGQASEEASTDKRLTYEEVFQVQLNVDDASLAGAHEDEERSAEVDEAMEIEAEGQPSAEEPVVEEALAEEALAEEHPGTSEEDIQALEPDLDGAVDHVEAVEVETDAEPVKALEVDDESQDALQKMREAFAARAKEAELRVKQREAELDEAASAPKSKS